MRDRDGFGVPDATVHLIGGGSEEDEQRQMCNEAGSVGFPHRPQTGEVRIDPLPGRGLASARYAIDPDGGAWLEHVTLEPSTYFLVRVEDERAAPLDGIVVRALSLDAAREGHAVQTGIGATGPGGVASFTGAVGSILVAEDPSGKRIPIGRPRRGEHRGEECHRLVLADPGCTVGRFDPVSDRPHARGGRLRDPVLSEIWTRSPVFHSWSFCGFTDPGGSFFLPSRGTSALLLRPVEEDYLPGILVGSELEYLDEALHLRRASSYTVRIQGADTRSPVWVQTRGPDGSVLDGGFARDGLVGLRGGTDGLGRIEALAESADGTPWVADCFLDYSRSETSLSLELKPDHSGSWWTDAAGLGFCSPFAGTRPWTGWEAAIREESTKGIDVRGTVAANGQVDQDLSGFEILLWRNGELCGQALTDACGEYRFDDLAPPIEPTEDTRLTVLAPWYRPFASRDFGFRAPSISDGEIPPVGLRECSYLMVRLPWNTWSESGWKPLRFIAYAGSGPEVQLGPGAHNGYAIWFTKVRSGLTVQLTMYSEAGRLEDCSFAPPIVAGMRTTTSYDLLLEEQIPQPGDPSGRTSIDPRILAHRIYPITAVMAALRSSPDIYWQDPGRRSDVIEDLVSIRNLIAASLTESDPLQRVDCWERAKKRVDGILETMSQELSDLPGPGRIRRRLE